MKKYLFLLFSIQGLIASSAATAQENLVSTYRSELNIVYSTVDGKELKLNAFLPENATNPTPAIVEIHGGWLFGGEAASKVDGMGGWQVFTRHGLAIFSIQYRLGEHGGIPQCIRDCRNAIRFIRQNAKRFSIDPNRIDVTGGSAGGYLSLMAAMVPDDFPDGGPTPGLEGVSAKVSGSFSFIPPTDFVRFWDEGPEDVITNADEKISFRAPDNKIPNDARPHLRVLFHGIIPDTDEHKALYTKMCPIGQVRKDVPPLLICDGEKDPIVPGLEGKELYEKLVSVGADATYWMTPNGGHAFPGGAGFGKVLDDFIVHSFKRAEATNALVLPPGANSAVFPVPHTGAGPEKDVQNKMDRFGGKHFDIVFDGDSIMNRWETTGKEIWNQRYAGIAADFGIEGDHVENVLWRLDPG
jgi:acetyl esterase/lipase